MRAILNVLDGENMESEVVCGNAAALRRVAGGLCDAEDYFCEAAGHAFNERFEARQNTATNSDEEEDVSDII